MTKRTRSLTINDARRIINKELFFFVQSKAATPVGGGVGLWVTHKEFGDNKETGSIKGRHIAIDRMDEAKKQAPHRHWRVIGHDQLNFYQEGVNDHSRQLVDLEERARRISQELASLAILASKKVRQPLLETVSEPG